MAFCRVKITNGHFSVFEKADSFCLVIGSIIVAKFGFPFIDGLFCNLKCIGSQFFVDCSCFQHVCHFLDGRSLNSIVLLKDDFRHVPLMAHVTL